MSGLLLSAFLATANAETPVEPPREPVTQEALAAEIAEARDRMTAAAPELNELTTKVEALQPAVVKLNALLKLQSKLGLEDPRGNLYFPFTIKAGGTANAEDTEATLQVQSYNVYISVGDDRVNFRIQGGEVSEVTLNRDVLTAANPKVEAALDAATTAVQERIKTPNPVAQKQAELLRAGARLNLGSNWGLDFSFEVDGVKGRLERGSRHVTITMGDNEIYFGPGDDGSQIFRLNGAVVPETNPLVVAALNFAIKGVEAEAKDLHYTTVKASKPGSAVTLRSVEGDIIEDVPAGTWVATVGTPNPSGFVLAFTDPDADSWLDVGWIHESVLNAAPAALPAPVAAGSAAPVETAGPTPAETFKPYQRFVSPSAAPNGGLNLRSKPSGEKEALTGEVLPVGTEVTVVGEDSTDDPRDWVQVTYSVNGSHAHTRWVSGDYLVATKGAAAPVEAPKPSVYEATVSTAVGADGLKLRDAAVDGAVQLRIPSGATVRVVGKDGPDWSKVEVVVKGTTYTGFVATQYLEAKQE